MRRLAAMLGVLGLLLSPLAAGAGEAKAPSGKALAALVHAYLEADFGTRLKLRASWDESLAPLDPRRLVSLRKEMLKLALKKGPKLKKGTQYFYDAEEKRGKYILSGKAGKALFLGLHGGGRGSGDAGSAAGSMGGGGWLWIYPEVLVKTEHGWTDSGTEAFVIELIQAAKRTWKNLDPNRIFISGHSMGGYGSWTIGAHHADMFAGIGPYAGAPTLVNEKYVQEGVLPNLYNVPLHFYQSGDDKNVLPLSNDIANKELERWKKEHPKGFDFRYDRVEGRGHAAPKEGYLPSQKWLASHDRKPRPKKFLWQPVLPWKRHFYWVYWAHAELEATLQVEAQEGNRIEITTLTGSGDVSGLSVLLGAPLVDLTKDVVVVVNGKEAFRGPVKRTFSTLMMTLPRLDDDLLFDARVDL